MTRLPEPPSLANSYDPATEARDALSKGEAVGSLVLALVACIPFANIAAIVLGIRCLRKQPSAGNRTMSLIGIVIGVITLGIQLIVIPASLNRIRGTTDRIKCAAQLREIKGALSDYAQQHQATYPPDLRTLVTGELLPAYDLVCPDDTDPASDKKPNGSYIYRGGGARSYLFANNEPLAYEPPGNHHDGGNVLRLDGSIHFEPVSTIASFASLPATIPVPPMYQGIGYPAAVTAAPTTMPIATTAPVLARDKFLGTWRCGTAHLDSDQSLTATLKLNSDNTFTYTATAPTGPIELTGTWGILRMNLRLRVQRKTGTTLNSITWHVTTSSDTEFTARGQTTTDTWERAK